jgi:WD40 repeat protein
MQLSTIWHGDYIASVSVSGAINWFDIKAPQAPKLVFEGTTENIKSFAVDRKNGRLYCGDTKGKLTEFDVKTGLGYWFKGGKGHEVKSIAAVGVSADGKTVVTAGFDDKLKISAPGHTWGNDSVSLGGQPVALAISPSDSGLVAVVLIQDKLVMVKDGKVASELNLGFKGASIDFSADGKKLIVGGSHKKVVVYDVRGSTASTSGVAMECERDVAIVNGSPDGKFWVALDKNRNVNFWDQKGTSLNIGWNFHSATIQCGAFSPSGRRYATGGADLNIIVWSDFKNFNPVRLKFEAHAQGVAHVGWLDENTIVSVGDDRVIKVWTIPEQQS